MAKKMKHRIALYGLHVNPERMPRDTHKPDGWHRHRCRDCGAEWAHDGKTMPTHEDMDIMLPQLLTIVAHTCPDCGSNLHSNYQCVPTYATKVRTTHGTD